MPHRGKQHGEDGGGQGREECGEREFRCVRESLEDARGELVDQRGKERGHK